LPQGWRDRDNIPGVPGRDRPQQVSPYSMSASEPQTEGLERRYKRPESVLILVCTRIGEVLLMERTRPHGFWQSVTGSLHWGESAPAAAARELTEETGLDAGHRLLDLHRGEHFPIIPPWRARYAPGAHVNREHWFMLELASRRTIRLDPAEHRQCRWLNAEQAARRGSSWTNRKLIREWMLNR
jgi:dATP pyrophosphohydrolase